MKKQKIIITAIILFVLIVPVSSVSGIFNLYDTLSFGGKCAVQGNDAPVLKHPNPSNNSFEVLPSLDIWNITIEDPNGDTFDWTITVNGTGIGYNASTGDTNGSKIVDVLGNLSLTSAYTVWVNATDGNASVSEVFLFYTQNETVFIPYSTLSFGGKASIQGNNPVISNEEPTNESADVSMYPMLNVTVSELQGQLFNITWLTNASGTWTIFAYNSSCTNGTYRQRAPWANSSNTIYGWYVKVNDTEQYWTNDTFWFRVATYAWGNWSSWWEFDYTCCSPTNFDASTYNASVINLTWTNCEDGADRNVLVVNVSGWLGYPLSPTNGTEIYNGTNATFNHTGLATSTTYSYTIWGYNITENNYSLVNYSDAALTSGDFAVCCPFPINQSTEITRPSTNLSVRVNGTAIEAYVYFWNMTPTTDIWTLLYNWTLSVGGWPSVNELNTNNGTTQFIWGNTTYIWSANATDGSTWVNTTYEYTTIQFATGANARLDINKDNIVDVFDLNNDWSKRAGQATYDNLYDVNNDNVVDVFDLNSIWSGRS